MPLTNNRQRFNDGYIAAHEHWIFEMKIQLKQTFMLCTHTNYNNETTLEYSIAMKIMLYNSRAELKRRLTSASAAFKTSTETPTANDSAIFPHSLHFSVFIMSWKVNENWNYRCTLIWVQCSFWSKLCSKGKMFSSKIRFSIVWN